MLLKRRLPTSWRRSVAWLVAWRSRSDWRVREVFIDENTSPGDYPDLYAAVGIDPAEAFATMIIEQVSAITRPAARR
ncbi:MAG: hypothetical protein ACI8RZ_004062 [Myxococcota bacterium]|jgi:hypothetical protein